MDESKRFAVVCKNGHEQTSFDELSEANRIAQSYTMHRLTCSECGNRDFVAIDREA